MTCRDTKTSRASCAEAALDVGTAVREAVQKLSLKDRSRKCPSPLKPAPANASYPDVVGEEVAFVRLRALSSSLACTLRVIIDPTRGEFIELGPPAVQPDLQPNTISATGSQPHDTAADTYEGTQSEAQTLTDPALAANSSALHIWVYLDAVDGTVKISGLNSQPNRLRAVNDGSWGIGIAFTDPTTSNLADLTLADFTVAGIVDGSPSSYPSYPTAAIAEYDDALNAFVTRNEYGQQLYTSTNTVLNQSFVYLDGFQAYDHNTAEPGDAQLVPALYTRLIDRHQGGAFDVLRTYGNLSSLIRCILGYQGAAGLGPNQADHGDGEVWFEAQCGGFIVVNENLANLIPSVPVVAGAGGIATDLQGGKLLERKLAAGRTSVLYAANTELHNALLQLAAIARPSG